MKNTLVYFSSCALDASGRVGPFLLQELPWLLNRFDRVVVCDRRGVAELTQPGSQAVPLRRPVLGTLRAVFRAPFHHEFRREWRHLRADHCLNAKNAAKLYLFTVRGLRMHYWAEALIAQNELVTLYSFWMSYDAFAAALSKRRHPEARAVARGHRFDIDPAANPMNPYLMKRFLGETLDGIYPISRNALECLTLCAPLPSPKLHVLALGCSGGEPGARFNPPFYTDGVFRIVSCATVIPRKQLPVLIDALSQWRDTKVRWLHIGGGPEEEAVRAYAQKKLGGHANVSWEITGTVSSDEVARYYDTQAFDVFVNTSASEGVPVSIMEAMRAGLIVVAPAINGIPELADDSFALLYTPSDDAAQLLKALRAVSALPRERALAMREASSARWNGACRSDLLLEKLFPRDAKEADTR